MFSIEFVNQIRGWELDRIARHFRPGARILEIGAGTGQQALALAERGFAVEAIELASSEYSASRVFSVTDYDGVSFPFPDCSFDFVFSSNVLEHVPDLPRLHAETLRVLKPGGRAVHVLPTPSWRFWSIISHLAIAAQYIRMQKKWLLPRRTTLREFRVAWSIVGSRLLWAVDQHRHGVRGNPISEIWIFRAGWWRRNFLSNGFEIEQCSPMGLFYTGHFAMEQKLGAEARMRLARYLGSACRIFVLRPVSQ